MKPVSWVSSVFLVLAGVTILCGATGAETLSTGTAFRVSPRGHLLTNYHVVEGCRSAVVYIPPDGFHLKDPSALAITMTLQLFLGPEAIKAEPKSVRILKTDPQNDLALLIPEEIESRREGTQQARRVVKPYEAAASGNDDLHYAKFRAGNSIAPGESVTVVGFPLRGLLTEVNVTNGIVSSLAGVGGDKNLVQITAPVQAGNSGGPLLDDGGNVIGVVVAKLEALQIWQITGDLPQNVNFAIRGKIAQDFVQSFPGTALVSAPPSEKKGTAAIAQEAIQFTFPVECRP